MEAGEVYSFTVPVGYRMSDQKAATENKAIIIEAANEVVVYASNNQVNTVIPHL